MSTTPMGPQEYLQERVEQQLSWYGKKSAGNKSRYQLLRLLQISLGILVSAGGVYAEAIPHGAWLISGFGVLISLSAAWETVFDHQNNWIRYRRIQEELKREKILYATASGPYRRQAAQTDGDETAFTLFVERVEGLLGEEVEQWSSTATKPAAAGSASTASNPDPRTNQCPPALL
ncbi:MAG: DUF4231 domain-containing protein [Cyanobium sp.]